MTFTTLKSIVDAELNGQFRYSEFVKNINQTTSQGVWYDTTGSAGNPRAKQWFDSAPLTAAAITQSNDGGIFHGKDLGTGQTKYLRSIKAYCANAASLPMALMLCDYLLYYPTCEDGTTDVQTMTNTVTLPRYTDGKGVQMMAITISARTGGQTFTVNYTNSDGVAGRVTPTITQTVFSSPPGTVVSSSRVVADAFATPFLPLQSGDSGVRSIQSVTMNGVDTGFFALVLVKPIAELLLREVRCPYEKDLLLMANELPIIQDDAYLSMLVFPMSSLSGAAVRGSIKTVWN